MREDVNTIQRILQVAKKEFLQKGYNGASLRRIVKNAGVTTGAFYGYYKSKEELFDALVQRHAEYIMSVYINAQNDFADLPKEKQLNSMNEISGSCMEDILEYMYKYPDEIKLILCSSEGTKYENFIHEMVEIEIEATHKFNDVLNSLGKHSKLLSPSLEHMLISGMFSAYFEMIIHDMPYEEAVCNLKDLRMFYTAGWQKIMGF